MTRQTSWICCQLGAREHYAIPRSLHQAGNLSLFVTDAWVKPRSLLNSVPNPLLKSLQERFHPTLVQAPIQDFTTSLIQFELTQRFRKTSDWERMIARNQWFQAHTLHYLQKAAPRIAASCDRPILFTYSYAGLELLRYAKFQGWYTVLGQIDPGPIEEQIVITEHQKFPQLAPAWQPVPPQYWENWRAECKLADRILVNSTWSAQLLAQTGIEPDKIQTVPLVYEPPAAAASFTRTYPTAFSTARPLRVLFLGLVTLRKGIAAVLEAISLLTNQPIEFWFVGSQQITIPPKFVNHPQIRWIGTVPRSQTQDYYQQADVFLFPTLSDGFGLTQLEAQAWQLPIVASACCGEVVVDGINGRILPEINGQRIAELLQDFLCQPQQLAALAQPANQPPKIQLIHFVASTSASAEF